MYGATSWAIPDHQSQAYMADETTVAAEKARVTGGTACKSESGDERTAISARAVVVADKTGLPHVPVMA